MTPSDHPTDLAPPARELGLFIVRRRGAAAQLGETGGAGREDGDRGVPPWRGEGTLTHALRGEEMCWNRWDVVEGLARR